MARNRTIKPTFWSDIKIGELKRDARLLYIALWNFADDYGVVTADRKMLRANIFPYDDIKVKDFDDWIKSLEITGMITMIEYDGKQYYAIVNFGKHQVICRPSVKMANIPVEILSELIDKSKKIYDIPQAQEQPPAQEVEELEVEEEYDEVAEAYNKFKEWCSIHAPTVLKMKRPITKEEFIKLKSKYGVDKMTDYLQRMDNWMPLTKRCTSAYRTLINWIEKDERNNEDKRPRSANSKPNNAGVGEDYAASILARMGGGKSDG